MPDLLDALRNAFPESSRSYPKRPIYLYWNHNPIAGVLGQKIRLPAKVRLRKKSAFTIEGSVSEATPGFTFSGEPDPGSFTRDVEEGDLRPSPRIEVTLARDAGNTRTACRIDLVARLPSGEESRDYRIISL